MPVKKTEIKNEVNGMAEVGQETQAKEAELNKFFVPSVNITFNKEPKSLLAKIQRIRVELLTYDLKPSGENKFAKFSYFALKDFIPTLNYLMDKYGVTSAFNLTNEIATLDIIDVENPNDKITFSTPVADAEVKGCTAVQNLGSIHTYLKRYLYLNAFEISENDVLDTLVGDVSLKDASATKLAKQQSIKGNATPNTSTRVNPFAPTSTTPNPLGETSTVPTPQVEKPIENPVEVWKQEIRNAVTKRTSHAKEITEFIKNQGLKISLVDLATEDQYKAIISFINTIATDI
jgi:hypothetical protein